MGRGNFSPTTRTLRWTSIESPLGSVLAAASSAGVVAVRVGGSNDAVLAELAAELPAARFERAEPHELDDVERGLARLAEGLPAEPGIALDLDGTPFQLRVWAALRAIPRGETRSYAQVALAIAAPSSVRAAARACATNPAALLVPCHRVIRSDGGLGGYRWGIDTKRSLLESERRPG